MNKLEAVLKQIADAWSEADRPSDLAAFGMTAEDIADSDDVKIVRAHAVFSGKKWDHIGFEELILSPNILSALTNRGATYYLGSYLYLCAKKLHHARDGGHAYTLLIQAFGRLKILIQSDVLGKRFTVMQTRAIEELLSFLGRDYQEFYLEGKAFSRRSRKGQKQALRGIVNQG